PFGDVVLGVPEDADAVSLADDELLLHEGKGSDGRGDHAAVAQGRACAGERAGHQTIPAREDLLVTEGPGTSFTRLEHLAASAVERPRCSCDVDRRAPGRCV